MEEITTRFEIIRLAVTLGDFRTIDLQCEKLRSLSLDDTLNEIIDLLESRNYRQALYEMKHYAKSLEDEFFAQKNAETPSSRPSRTKPAAEPGLFDLEDAEDEETEEERVLNLDDILRLSKQERTRQKEYRAAPAFDLEESDAPQSPSDEPRIPETAAPIAEPPSQPEPEEPLRRREPVRQEAEPSEGMSLAEHLPDETPFGKTPAAETPEPDSGERSPEEPALEPATETPRNPANVRERQAPKATPPSRDSDTPVSRRESPADRTPIREAARTTAPSDGDAPSKSGSRRHPPISYISQKFRNMIHQFPPVEPEPVFPPELEAMQKKIADEGYTDEEIDTFLKRYQAYKEAGRRGEAALVLLLAAATESQFAQFLLARELFRGEIIRQDHAEAFTQINTLADQNFAEAICDLGQFYEHGIGIGKDRQMALLLYEEAAEMGIARAQKHYDRLKNSRGLKGIFKKVSLPSIPLPKKRG